MVLVTLAGIPEDGHQEEGGAAEASQGEVRHQHRPSQMSAAMRGPHAFPL